MKSNRAAAQMAGLDLEDLLDERQRHLSQYLAHEEVYFVLWTRPKAVSAMEIKEAVRLRAEQKWVVAEDAQHPFAALGPLVSRHKGYVSGIVSVLEDLSIKASVASVHQSLAAIRASLYPTLSHDDWKANVPGDVITPHTSTEPTDASEVLWPPLRRQICTGDAEIIKPTIVRIGDLCWGGVDMTLGPADPAPFPQLLARMINDDMPFHLSILIESAGTDGSAFRTFLAAVLAFTNEVNRQIRESLKALQELSQSEPVVRLRISLSTYAPSREVKLVETRLASLTQALEAWGYCQGSSSGGDPLEMTLSSALGLGCASTAPPALAPFRDVLKLLPLQRASSPFKEARLFFAPLMGAFGPIRRAVL